MKTTHHRWASRIVGALLGFVITTTGPLSAQDEVQDAPAASRDVFHQAVAWSPDGKRLAISEYPGDTPFRLEKWAIHVLAFDGSGGRELTGGAVFMSWSPDGARIVFDSVRDGNSEIYTIGADGSDVRRLTTHEAKDDQPAWSPDGRHIAFCSDRDGSRSVYVMDTDGTHARRLTSADGEDYNPAWSPDGSRLVFYRATGDRHDQVHVVAADGTGERRVTDGTRLNIYPSFLPDGRIGFTSIGDDGVKALVTIEPDGSGRAPVGAITASFARWSPDGSRLAYVAGRWPKSSVFVARADGTETRRIAG